MFFIRKIVELGRNIRNEIGIRTRQPLSKLFVSMRSDLNLLPLKYLIEDELNVKEVIFKEKLDDFMAFSLRLNFQQAGPILGEGIKDVKKYLEVISDEEISKIINDGKITTKFAAKEVTLFKDFFFIEKKAKKGYAMTEEGDIVVILETVLTKKLEEEGFVRELIRVVQELRKEKKLPIEKRINIILSVEGNEKEALLNFEDLFKENVLVKKLEFRNVENMDYVDVLGKRVGVFFSP